MRPFGDDFPSDVVGLEAGTAESIDLERAISSLPDGARKVFGLTDVGRTTLRVLNMNDSRRVQLRQAVASLENEPNQ